MITLDNCPRMMVETISKFNRKHQIVKYTLEESSMIDVLKQIVDSVENNQIAISSADEFPLFDDLK